jgi:hypothetical protein
MTATVLRKELQEYIAKMPEHKLVVLKPLLSEFAKPTYTIEPASPRECKLAEKHFQEYYENPSSFVSWQEVKQKLKVKSNKMIKA